MGGNTQSILNQTTLFLHAQHFSAHLQSPAQSSDPVCRLSRLLHPVKGAHKLGNHVISEGSSFFDLEHPQLRVGLFWSGVLAYRMNLKPDAPSSSMIWESSFLDLTYVRKNLYKMGHSPPTRSLRQIRTRRTQKSTSRHLYEPSLLVYRAPLLTSRCLNLSSAGDATVRCL